MNLWEWTAMCKVIGVEFRVVSTKRGRAALYTPNNDALKGLISSNHDELTILNSAENIKNLLNGFTLPVALASRLSVKEEDSIDESYIKNGAPE